MRYFTLLLDPEGRGISEDVRRSYEALPGRRGLEFAWQIFEHAAVLTAWDDPYGDPLVVQHEGRVAVGMVRLDNRADVECWGECKGEELTDLGVVLRVVERHGTKYIPELLGDFAFVVCGGGRTAVAGVDAFAVKRLFYSEREGVFAFASRAEGLAVEERFNTTYLTMLLALHTSAHDLSVYAGVQPIPAACLATLDRRVLKISEYWNAAAFHVEHTWGDAEQESVEEFRRLLATSIRTRLGGMCHTWAQLSGGLDSSSVVSLVQWLAERKELPCGLAGAVTYVDRQRTGADEREYSDAVVRRWGLLNQVIVDPPTWHDRSCAPPWSDQPTFDLQVYPRERRLCELVRGAGGRILLTGWGGDELLMGSMLYFADWLAQGMVWRTVREMARVAAQGRVSFWELAGRNAVGPLLPGWVRNRILLDKYASPTTPWLTVATLRRHGITSRNRLAADYAGRIGQKYPHAIRAKAASLSELTDRGILGDSLDLRHPFLYRPLVEFALRLPPVLRARPHAQRWILRQAMRGILPESVRTRVGKSDTGAALAWSLRTEGSRLACLTERPILGDLGIIDAAKLRAEFNKSVYQTNGGEYMHAKLLSTIAVEAWLQMRCGRWPCQTSDDAAA